MKKRHASRFAAHILRIAEGRKNLGKVRNRRIPWSDLIGRLAAPTVTQESFKAFLALPKEEQDKLKNVNGYWIGAHCAESRRHKSAIAERNSIALDVDDAPAGLPDLIELGLTGVSHLEFAVHSTRKHTKAKPRLRIVFPLKHPIPADQYTAAARILASMLDPTMDMIDDVSFRLAQMMYWPSHSKDAPFFFHHNAGELLDAGAMLDAWGNWRDHMLLPFSEKQGQVRPSAAKAEDPTEKGGIVGAFCRAYRIEDAIETFLSDIYVAGDTSSGKPRFTYVGGSTANGFVVEDDGRFGYSHHTSDPVSDRLCNAWDLVRIHLFGDLDPDTPDQDVRPGKLPSWAKMHALAVADEAVLAEFNPHLADLFTDEDVAEPVNGYTNGHTNGHAAIEDPEIAAILGLEPAIRVEPKAKKKPGPLEKMNAKHAVVRMGGRTLAMSFAGAGKVNFGTVADLHTFYENQPMPKPTGGVEPLSKWWNKQPGRRTYPGGVVFAPGKDTGKDTYNLWTGFAVEPDPAASCRLFLAHILDVVCSGDEAQFRYVMGWFAQMIQRPAEKPGVALVLRGIKGAGKDTVGEYVGALFPNHYVVVNRMEHLSGKFNSHQESALLMHVEEGFWAGDKNAAGSLQSVITAPSVLIERKGIDPILMDSYLRVLISSNERWVVPATMGERRYAVFNVSDRHAQDIPYFTALRREMNNGGLAGLLHYLQTLDLSTFDVRKVPETTGLADQKAAGLKGIAAWWYERLDSGDLADDSEDLDKRVSWDEGGIRVGVNNLYETYKDWMQEHRGFGHGPIESKVVFGRELKRLCPEKGKGQRGKRFQTTEIHKFPDLIMCRKTFDGVMGSNFDWDAIEDDDDLIG